MIPEVTLGSISHPCTVSHVMEEFGLHYWCIGKVMFQLSLTHVSHILLSTVDCGRPESPRNGSVGSHPATTEGSVVLYQCDQNLVPEELMRSVCTVSGWSPNPAEQVCNVGML